MVDKFNNRSRGFGFVTFKACFLRYVPVSAPLKPMLRVATQYGHRSLCAPVPPAALNPPLRPRRRTPPPLPLPATLSTARFATRPARASTPECVPFLVPRDDAGTTASLPLVVVAVAHAHPAATAAA